MADEPRSSRRAYWLSVFIGAYLGVTLQMVVTYWGKPFDRTELWAIPVILLGYGTLAVPFVALGLTLFGLPATGLLRRLAQEWWVGVVAALWGAVAGKLMYFGIDHLMFFGSYNIIELRLLDLGVMYGLPTGFAWWTLHRRELATP
jgi:hypothetical protein